MVSGSVVVVLGLLFTVSNVQSKAVKADGDQDWWKTAVFYQIYPRSFKDSNGDGIGDIQGIISKLDHLKDAGITATWLSPIYKSPQVDQGYDISDYTDIHYEYGTIEDVDELIKAAHDLGIKVIMDFVPNHSSHEHPWFLLSENRTSGYEDYYIWRDGVNSSTPPNNWISIFGNSAWTWSETRQQFYLHQFDKAQPDLNYRNEQLVQEMKDVLVFWMDRGIDGFRIDAVPYLIEDEQFLDEPLSGDESAGPTEYNYLTHIYTMDQQGTYDIIYSFREVVDNYTSANGGDARVLMTEAYTTLNNTLYFYGTPDGSQLGAHFTFNFQLISYLTENSNASEVVNTISEWVDNLPPIYTSNWVVGNHDQHRVATRLGPKNVDGYNMIVMLLPGIGVTYNGEEIGMEDGEVTFEQGKDPSACKYNSSVFDQLSRDFERTPFHWDTTANAGFSNTSETWLPVSEKYLETNLADQSVSGVASHYHVYQDLIKLRQEDAFLNGNLEIKALSSNVVAFTRSTENDTYVVVFNLGDTEETVNLQSSLSNINSEIEAVVVAVNSTFSVGSKYSTSSIAIQGHDSFVAKATSGALTATASAFFLVLAVLNRIF